MAAILEDDDPGIDSLSVGAVLLTVLLCGGIIWNALMNQPIDSAAVDLPPGGAARVSVSLQDAPGGTITLRFDPVVEDVQRALAESGYYNGPIDGVAGKRTQNAIEAFQSANGLDVTGKASSELVDRIKFAQQIAEAAGVPATASTRPAPDGRILGVQKSLSELGYAPGTIDGSMGEQTRQAIRDFERDRNLPVSGEISQALINALDETTGQSDESQ